MIENPVDLNDVKQ